MALVHNVIIRGMNSIYLQCEYVTNQMAPSFLSYCQCWTEFIQNHHGCEEVAYFPIIEEAVGVEGLSEGNLEQHDAFLAGLQEFEKYVYHIPPNQYDGRKIIELLDSFATTLQSHLTDEVIWILALSRFPHLNLAAIDSYHKSYVIARQSPTRMVPFLLTNHDVLYESGVHSNWPMLDDNHIEKSTVRLSARLRDYWVRYICILVHKNIWKYSSCTVAGIPKALEGLGGKSIRNSRTVDSIARLEQRGSGSKQCPQ